VFIYQQKKTWYLFGKKNIVDTNNNGLVVRNLDI